VRFHHLNHGRKIFAHTFKYEEWPQNLKRLPTFYIEKTKTEGLILVLPDNKKHYSVFTPDLQGKGYQVKHVKDDQLEWSSHLVFSFPKSDYAYEVEYSATRGQLRISYFTVDPEFEGDTIFLLGEVVTGYNELVVFSFELDGHTYWRVLLVRKTDCHILVVTFEISPKDPKDLSYFVTSTYEWGEGMGWDFTDAFRHRNLSTQYLLTFHNGNGKKGLFEVENDRDSIIKILEVPIKQDVDSPSKTPPARPRTIKQDGNSPTNETSPPPPSAPARAWTHHAIIH